MSDTWVSPGSNSPGRSLDKAVEGAVKRDKIIILLALSTVVVLSWAYILSGAGMSMSASEMTGMILGEGETHIMTPAVWNPGYFVLMFFMWWIMMVAMMLPSATPMLLLFAVISRKQQEKGKSFTSTSIFASAYLIVWAGFSIVAVVVQWGLQEVGFLSPMLESESVILGGVILLAAGIYQLTPLKRACLNHCRSPLQFIMTRWRNGTHGVFLMGIEHGAYCVGCCWFLMCLLFFGGIMNLFWISGLAVYILLEKTIPMGHWATNIIGVALIVWGITVLGYHSLG